MSRNEICIFYSCEFAGRPPPHLEWRIGDKIVSGTEPILRQRSGESTKKLRLLEVGRKDHGANLTCTAFNSNLTDPLSEVVRLNLYRELF